MNTLFERSVDNYKDEWLTPPSLKDPLGEFDLDPCSPVNRPWDTAKKHYTIHDDGLLQPWEGRVWCNPPYSTCEHWLKKASHYGNAIVLIFARTETNMFFRYVWPKANGILFIKGRVQFGHITGKKSGAAGAPSILIAYGEDNARMLQACSSGFLNTIPGKFIRL